MASETLSRPEPTVIQTGSAVNHLPPSLGPGRLPATPNSSSTSSFPQVIPDIASHKGRNLILCFDGTGDQYDQDNSNIVRFVQLLKKDDRSKQMVYYQAGIGTGVGPKPIGKLSTKLSKAIDSAVATGLSVHVRGGYEFLMQNYTEGDRISLFGFSRGAYTARALAGMLHKVGLLPAYNHEQVPFAYSMFKRDDPEGWKMSNGFKRAFSIDVKIDFVGVFDTVNSVGIIPRELPFAKSNHLIRVFRHAVALDERRAKFKANLWSRVTEDEERMGEAGKRKVYQRAKTQNGIFSFVTGGDDQVEEGEDEDDKKQPPQEVSHHDGYDCTTAAQGNHETDVKEVWFAGAHCDIGGGSVPNATLNNLARIPLRWMIRECFLNNTGILFHSAELEELGISPASLWPVVKIPTPPSEGPTMLADEANRAHNAEPTGTTLVESSPHSPEPTGTDVPGQVRKRLVPDTPVQLGSEEDAKDALSPIYDQLSLVKWWWVLEVLPLRQRYQKHDKSWANWYSMNLGGPRVIHGQRRFPIYVHRSVQYRMQQLGYKPRAELLESPGPVWVD